MRSPLALTATIPIVKTLTIAALFCVLPPGSAHAQTVTDAPLANAPGSDTQRPPRAPVSRPRDQSPSALIGNTQSTPPPGLISDWQQIHAQLGARGIGLTAR